MKSTGVIRKIDELGRIVLPKEIRRKLGIRDGENLEIFVDNENIMLKKYSKIKDYNDIIESICNLTCNIYNMKLIVTDRDKVIYTNVMDNILNREIEEGLLDLIHNRESVSKNEIRCYNFGDISLKGYFYIFPIISSIDCLGLIMLYSENILKEEYFPLLKLISSIIVNKIDIS